MSHDVLRMQLQGANPEKQVSGEDELPGKHNYFVGNDPKKWRTNVSTYGKVRYSQVYPGIDLIYYGKGQELEFDLVVAPGATSNSIRLSFEGTDRITIDGHGEVVLKTINGEEVRLRRPVAYQLVTGNRREVSVEYARLGEHGVGVKVGLYDLREPLVIDPILSYAYRVVAPDSGDSDLAQGVAVDSSGNMYVTGYTGSLNFPTAGAIQSFGGGAFDAFITKLNATGSTLVYSTYFGGNKDDLGYGIAVDSFGNAYVTGQTSSTDFPTANALQPAYGAGTQDAFIAKLDATGSVLTYSTYLGGNSDDAAQGIAVDGSGSAYVTGWTNSANFPTANPFQPTYAGGPRDAFVTKVNAAGSALTYSTYLGDSGFEMAWGIAVDSLGNAYLVGETNSTNFPTSNPLQPHNGGGSDAFVSKLNATGSALTYSTYLGGSGEEFGQGIAVDSSGNAAVTGYTDSTDFPMVNALQSTYAEGGDDIFIAKVNAVGSALVYSTYLGGSGDDTSNGIAMDASGNAYVTGKTTSTSNPAQPAHGGGLYDAVVAKVNAVGSTLVYSTYLGGSGDEVGWGIAVDGSGNAIASGRTRSADFPRTNFLQNISAFVVRVPEGAALTLIRPNSGMVGRSNLNVVVTAQLTHFLQGQTVASFGAGITVNSVTAIDATHATINITVASDAVMGTRNVAMTTGGEVVTLTDGFTVNKKRTGQVSAQ